MRNENERTRKTDSLLHVLSMPFALLCLSIMFGVIGWGGDKVLNDIKDNVIDVKNTVVEVQAEQKKSTQKIWGVLTDFKKCVNQSIVDCGCKNTTIC